jgi:hypothetical protein
MAVSALFKHLKRKNKRKRPREPHTSIDIDEQSISESRLINLDEDSSIVLPDSVQSMPPTQQESSPLLLHTQQPPASTPSTQIEEGLRRRLYDDESQNLSVQQRHHQKSPDFSLQRHQSLDDEEETFLQQQQQQQQQLTSLQHEHHFMELELTLAHAQLQQEVDARESVESRYHRLIHERQLAQENYERQWQERRQAIELEWQSNNERVETKHQEEKHVHGEEMQRMTQEMQDATTRWAIELKETKEQLARVERDAVKLDHCRQMESAAASAREQVLAQQLATAQKELIESARLLAMSQQEGMDWKRQFEKLKDRYKRWYKELELWIVEAKSKTCITCKKAKNLGSPPVMENINPVIPLTVVTVQPQPATNNNREPTTTQPTSNRKQLKEVSSNVSHVNPVTPSPWGDRSKKHTSLRVTTEKENVLPSNLAMKPVQRENSQTQLLCEPTHDDSPTQLNSVITSYGTDSYDPSQALLEPTFQKPPPSTSDWMQTKSVKHPQHSSSSSVSKKMANWTSNVMSRNFVNLRQSPANATPPVSIKPPPAAAAKLPDTTGSGAMPAISNNAPNAPPAFAFQEVVRKKADRQNMPGHACPECKAFWDTVCDDGTVFERKHFEDCSRHRAHHSPPSTPEGFWELSFADEIRARGGK